MKIWKLFILYIVFGMMAVSVVSAEEESTISSNDSSVVEPVNISSINSIDSLMASITGTGSLSVTQGKTDTSTLNTGKPVKSLTMYCTWNKPSNSLTFTIYTPSGKKCGPYSDSYNGAIDGNIGVTVKKSSGSWPADGVWTFKVYGKKVSGTQKYNMFGTWT